MAACGCAGTAGAAPTSRALITLHLSMTRCNDPPAAPPAPSLDPVGYNGALCEALLRKPFFIAGAGGALLAGGGRRAEAADGTAAQSSMITFTFLSPPPPPPLLAVMELVPFLGCSGRSWSWARLVRASSSRRAYRSDAGD